MDPKMTSRPTWQLWLGRGAGLALLLGAFGYFLTKVLSPDVAAVDFKYLWFAGHLWNEGVNPFGPDYLARAEAFFVDTNVPMWMAYPPYWYPWSRLLAQVPLDGAERLWGLLSGGMIVAGALIVAQAFRPFRQPAGRPALIAFAVFLMASSATAQALSMGQTAPMLFLGVALFIWGLARGSGPALCIALIILMLKPNFGLPFAVFAILLPGFGLWVILAAALSVAAMLPALAPHGVTTVLTAYAQILAAYGDHPANIPPALTGITNLLHHVAGANIGGIAPVLLAALVAAALALRLRADMTNGDLPTASRLSTAILLLTATMFLVPLHTYDLLLAAPVLLLPTLRPTPRLPLACAALAMFVLFRPNNIADATGFTVPGESYFAGSALVTLALLLLLAAVASVTVARAGASSGTPEQPKP